MSYSTRMALRILVAVVAAGLCCTWRAVAAPGAQGWQEDFSGARLGARWTWRTPVEGPSLMFGEREGWLRIRIPQREFGFNHWDQPAPIDDAPQLRTPAPAGDWELEARLELGEFGNEACFHVGLVVGAGDTQLLTWGIFYAPSVARGQQTPEAWMEPTGLSGYAKVPGEAKDVVLRLLKAGRVCRSALRRGDGPWEDCGTYTLADEARFLGIIGKTFISGAPVSFDVDYVRLIPRQAKPEPSPGPMTLVEEAELKELGQRLKGFAVWESNRTGCWELYRINTDGTGFRQLTRLGKPGDTLAYDEALRPRVSPDGKTILFAYGRKGGSIQTWTMPSAGGEPRKLTDGHPLNWSADGLSILFVRNRQLWRRELSSGKEAVAHATQLPETDRGLVGSASTDLKALAMRTPRSNEYFVLDGAKTVRRMGGCQSRFSEDGRYAYWAQGPKDFRVWDIAGNREWQILGEPPVQPYNYTYFPTVSADNGWLAYSASPGQHDHNTSDYEVYLVELKDWKAAARPIRLSWHPGSDRWPFLWVVR